MGETLQERKRRTGATTTLKSAKEIAEEKKKRDRAVTHPEESGKLAIEADDSTMTQLAKGMGQGTVDLFNFLTAGSTEPGLAALGIPASGASSELTDAFTSGVTFGTAPLLERHAGAAASALTDDSEMSYDDFLAQIDADRDKREAEHPIASATGGVAGSFVGTGGIAKAATKYAPKAAKALTNTLLKRLGLATGGGAAEALAGEAGEGDIDTINEALLTGIIGGGGGILGQAVGEGLSAGTRLVKSKLGLASEKDVLKMANEALTEGTGRSGATLAGAANDGKGFSPDELLAAQRSQRSGQSLSETDPRLFNIHKELAKQPAAVGNLGPTRELAERRLGEMPESLQQALLDNLTTSNKGVTGQIADTKAAAAASKAKGKDILGDTLDNDFATKYPVHNKKKFIGEVMKATDDQGKPLFDTANAVKSTQNAYKFFNDLVSEAGYKTKDMTLTMMHNIKMDLDRAITNASDATSADRISGTELFKLKKYVRDSIVKIDPDYADGTAAYATSMKSEEAMQAGADLMSGTNKTLPVHKVRDYMDTLLPAEKQSVQSGALEWIAGEMDDKANFINKIVKSPAMRQRLELVFGDMIDANATSVDDIADNIDRLLTQRQGYRDLAKSASPEAQLGKVTHGNKNEIAQHLIDLGVIGTKVGSGQSTSSAVGSSARRFMQSSASPQTQVLLDVLQTVDPTKTADLLGRILNVDKRNASMLSGRLSNALMQGINNLD